MIGHDVSAQERVNIVSSLVVDFDLAALLGVATATEVLLNAFKKLGQEDGGH